MQMVVKDRISVNDYEKGEYVQGYQGNQKNKRPFFVLSFIVKKKKAYYLSFFQKWFDVYYFGKTQTMEYVNV